MEGIGFHVKQVVTGGFWTVYEAIKVRGTGKGHTFAAKKIQNTDQISITTEITVQERLEWSKSIPKYHFKYTTDEYTHFIKGGRASFFDNLEDGHFPHEDVNSYLPRIIIGIKGLHEQRKKKKVHRAKSLHVSRAQREIREKTNCLLNCGSRRSMSEGVLKCHEDSFSQIQLKSEDRIQGSKETQVTDILSGCCRENVRMKSKPLVQVCESAHSPSDEYKILKFVGEGSFGKVAKCLKKGTGETVAMKICRFPDFSIFCHECRILQKLNSDDPDKFGFVRSVENFMYKNHFFMVFEMLQKNLFHHIEENNFLPLPMEGIRNITKQLLVALGKLQDLHIIHGDLKPENIMLVNHRDEPYRIKIIDFGMSIQLPTKKYSPNLGTLTYRAPEVILGCEYDEAVDMWSTGCIVAEMLVGEVLFPGEAPYDQIRFFDKVQGPFIVDMLLSEVAHEYFLEKTDDDGVPIFYLKVSSRVRRDYAEKKSDRKFCVEMIKEMLELIPERRISIDQALKCDFIQNGEKSENVSSSFS